jgi:exopolysaccharide biosynthesis WecB/TagA/CpsF family protein
MSGMIPSLKSALPTSLVKSIFGVAISDLSRENALGLLEHAIQSKGHMKLAFCNAHTANIAWSDETVRKTLKEFVVFADGIGVDIAARLLYGSAFTANLNGTDLVPAILTTSNSLRVAMIGGQVGIAEKAVGKLQAALPQHIFAPVLHGFTAEANQQTFLETLKQSPVDILLVAMGNPKQEQWIEANVTSEHATIAIGVGALFDFLADEVVRAPVWIQRARLEWLFRLAQEPKRLFRRYVLGNPLFLARVAMVKFGLRRF